MKTVLAVFLLMGSQQVGDVSITGRVTTAESEVQKQIQADLRYAGPGIEKRKAPDPSPAVVYLVGAPADAARESKAMEILQEGLEFRPRVVVVRLGTTVKFPNGDDLFHNVFSYSKAKRFDLGRYRKGESNETTFDKKGLVEVRCDIHKHMRAYIHVVDNPFFAVAREDGSYVIPKVPPGRYTLVAWKEFFDPVRQEIDVGPTGAKADFKLALRVRDGADRAASTGCCDGR